MQFSRIFLGSVPFLVLASLPLASATPPDLQRYPFVDRYIVELHSAPANEKSGGELETAPQRNDRIQVQKQRTVSLRTEQSNATADFAKRLGVPLPKMRQRVRQSFVHALNGLALNLRSDEVEALRTSPFVANIYKDGIVTTLLDNATKVVRAPDVWRLNAHGNECSGANCIRGDGIRIGIIDTGIDFRHPVLGQSQLTESTFTPLPIPLLERDAVYARTPLAALSGNYLVYYSNYGVLSSYRFSTGDVAPIELPSNLRGISSIALAGPNLFVSIAVGPQPLFVEKYQLLQINLDTRQRFVISEKTGPIPKVAVTNDFIVFSGSGTLYPDTPQIFAIDRKTGLERVVVPTTKGYPNFFVSGNRLVFGVRQSELCFSALEIYDLSSGASNRVTPPEFGEIRDLRGDELLYLECRGDQTADVMYAQYVGYNLRSGATRTFGAQARRPGFIGTAEGVPGTAKLTENSILFHKNFRSGRVYRYDTPTRTVALLNRLRGALDFVTDGERACFVFSDRRISCPKLTELRAADESSKGFNEKVVDGYDFVDGDNFPFDEQGHGTHVASIAAGSGAMNGVAPNAQVVALRALDMLGSGYDSEIIGAIERGMDPNGDGSTDDHLDILSLSLGGAGHPDDAKSRAVDNAVRAGVVVVVAAGNSGPEGNEGCRTLTADGSRGSICSPGTARLGLTVGATDNFDRPALFSSRGPVPLLNGTVMKPDVVAPGVAVCAARSAELGEKNLCDPSGLFTRLSGTSMATPVVAGISALVLQKSPSLSPAEVKERILTRSAKDLSLSEEIQGNGRVDALNAFDGVEFMNTPYIGRGGVRNAADYTENAAPGSLAAIFGTSLTDSDQTCAASALPLPLSLCGTEVWVSGRQAPLLYVSPGQINIQLPYELADSLPAIGDSVPVTVQGPNGVSNTRTLRVQRRAPALFTRSGTFNEAIGTHLDYSPVIADYPAFPGETIVLVATGFGDASPRVSTGFAPSGTASTPTPEVFFGDAPGEVLYAGKMPGFAGADQLNVVVPPNATRGAVRVCFGTQCSTARNLRLATDDGYLPFGIELSLPSFPESGEVSKNSIWQIHYRFTSQSFPAEWRKNRIGVPLVRVRFMRGSVTLNIVRDSYSSGNNSGGTVSVVVPSNVSAGDGYSWRIEAVGEPGVNEMYFGFSPTFRIK